MAYLQNHKHCVKQYISYKRSCLKSNEQFEQIFPNHAIFRTYGSALLFISGISTAFGELPDVKQMTVSEIVKEFKSILSLRVHADVCQEGRQTYRNDCIPQEKRDEGHKRAIEIYEHIVRLCDGRLQQLEIETAARKTSNLHQDKDNSTSSLVPPVTTHRNIYPKKKNKSKKRNKEQNQTVEFTDDVLEFLEKSIIENRKINDQKVRKQRDLYGAVIERVYEFLEKFKVNDLDMDDIKSLAMDAIQGSKDLESAARGEWRINKAVLLREIGRFRKDKQLVPTALQDISKELRDSQHTPLIVEDSMLRKILTILALGQKTDKLYVNLLNGTAATVLIDSNIQYLIRIRGPLWCAFDLLKKEYTVSIPRRSETDGSLEYSTDVNGLAKWIQFDSSYEGGEGGMIVHETPLIQELDARRLAYMVVNVLGLLKTGKFPWNDAFNVTIMTTLISQTEFIIGNNVVKYLSNFGPWHLGPIIFYCERLYYFDRVEYD